MDKGNKGTLINIIIIVITLFIIQFIFLDTYVKRSFVDDVISNTFYTKESGDIKMIEKYFDLYHDDLGEPDMLSVYSFIYSTGGRGIPLISAYEPRYSWRYDNKLDIPIISNKKNENIYIIDDGGEHFKTLLRGEILDIKVNRDGDFKLKKLVAIPIISNYNLNGFLVIGWNRSFKSDKKLNNTISSFARDVEPYVNYKSIHNTDTININNNFN